MLAGTGASRGVLSNRLNWLQSVGCLRKDITVKGEKRPTYHMTKKSIELYRNGLMAMIWERKYFTTPALDSVELIHDPLWQGILANHGMQPLQSVGTFDRCKLS